MLQAEVLELYDPHRTRGFTRAGRHLSRTGLLEELSALARLHDKDQGARLRFLVEPTSSPTLGELRRRILQRFPRARFDAWSSTSDDQARAGAAVAFGRPLDASWHLAEADVVLALDADLLARDGEPLRQAREYASRRGEAAAAQPALRGRGRPHRHRRRRRPPPPHALGRGAPLRARGGGRAGRAPRPPGAGAARRAGGGRAGQAGGRGGQGPGPRQGALAGGGRPAPAGGAPRPGRGRERGPGQHRPDGDLPPLGRCSTRRPARPAWPPWPASWRPARSTRWWSPPATRSTPPPPTSICAAPSPGPGSGSCWPAAPARPGTPPAGSWPPPTRWRPGATCAPATAPPPSSSRSSRRCARASPRWSCWPPSWTTPTGAPTPWCARAGRPAPAPTASTGPGRAGWPPAWWPAAPPRPSSRPPDLGRISAALRTAPAAGAGTRGRLRPRLQGAGRSVPRERLAAGVPRPDHQAHLGQRRPALAGHRPAARRGRARTRWSSRSAAGR